MDTSVPIVATQYAHLLMRCHIMNAYMQIPQNVRSRKSGRLSSEIIMRMNQMKTNTLNHVYHHAGLIYMLSAISSKVHAYDRSIHSIRVSSRWKMDWTFSRCFLMFFRSYSSANSNWSSFLTSDLKNRAQLWIHCVSSHISPCHLSAGLVDWRSYHVSIFIWSLSNSSGMMTQPWKSSCA